MDDGRWYWDESSGAWWYWDDGSGSWLPYDDDAAAASGTAAVTTTVAVTADDGGWSEAVDSATGAVYYYNAYTGESVWRDAGWS